MSITIELSPEREARLIALFGSPTALQNWLEGVIALTADHPVEGTATTKISSRRPLGQQREAVLSISPDFDAPLPDSFWLSEKP